MGNRAVITTRKNFENNGVGVYIHWYGGVDSVEAFLKYAELKGYRPPNEYCYGWARLCQIIGNFCGGSCSVGVDTVNNLNTGNSDNGTYIIDGWTIVERVRFYGKEQKYHRMKDMLIDIDESQPVDEQLGEKFWRNWKEE